MSRLRVRSVVVVLAGLLSGVALAAGPPRYVILMIADGAGHNTWLATAMYRGKVGGEFYDGPDWVRVAATNSALRCSAKPAFSAALAGTQLPGEVYDPARAWDDTPLDGSFAGYRWLRHAPDSANTATTLSTGLKTYVGAINMDGAGKPIEDTLARLAHGAGRRVGVVTSVPFNHATPAALGGAHAKSRSRYCSIALEMLTSPLLDVVGGAGHPGFDNNGRALADADPRVYTYVGDEGIWRTLTGGAPLASGAAVCADDPRDDPEAEARSVSADEIAALGRWHLAQTEREIEGLTHGATPQPLLLLPQVGQRRLFDGKPEDPHHPHDVVVGGTLQQQRGSRSRPDLTAPGDDPPIAGVPTLATLTRVALNALDDDPDGFFLHVEGGAVDWAMHGNQLGRMIEEMQDFEAAVQAVIDWIEAGPGWDDALLVVTADHDHLLWGPDADRVAFDPLQDNGAGRLPSHRWLSDGHSRLLVPVFARGRGAAGLVDAAVSRDPFYGPYLDQVDIHAVLRAALAEAPQR